MTSRCVGVCNRETISNAIQVVLHGAIVIIVSVPCTFDPRPTFSDSFVELQRATNLLLRLFQSSTIRRGSRRCDVGGYR